MDLVAALRLTLVCSADDEALFSPNYQHELKQLYRLGCRSRGA